MFGKIFRWLARAVRGKEQLSVVPGFLRPIDTDALAQELELKRNGIERGNKNLPASDETELDSIEQSITQRIVSEWTYQGDELINNLRAYNARLVGYSIHTEQAQLGLAAKNAVTRLQSASVQANAYLGPMKNEYLEARKEFEDFRTKHRLARPARDPAGRWTTYGFLFVLIAIESVLNGFFFQKGSEFGLIGGIGIAIGISAVNVMFAFGLGLWPARLMNHRNLLLRSLAFLVTLLGFGILILVHAFAAHFRDSVALLNDDGPAAMKAAINHLWNKPLEISDLYSAYLFALGIFFGIGAFWKGYTSDDPYPGYGAAYRRRENARENYSNEHRLLFDDLEKEKESTVGRLRDGIENIPHFPQLAAQILVQRGALIQRFQAYETGVVLSVNRLLQIYRDENRSRRTTPPPKHFGEKWILPHSFLKDLETNPPDTPQPVPQDEIRSIVAELEKYRDDVLSEYTKLMVLYPHPTNMP